MTTAAEAAAAAAGREVREIYKVTTPRKVVFGDPLYFEQFSGKKLNDLTVNLEPPKEFDARVVLGEFPIAGLPDTIVRTMSLYLAPKQTMDVYLHGKSFRGDEEDTRAIGVDSASYYWYVDGWDWETKTGGDGHWGQLTTYSRELDGKEYLQAQILTVCMPEDFTMEEMRAVLEYLFLNTQRIEETPIQDNQQKQGLSMEM